MKTIPKYYPSNIHGSKIRNAITGKPYDNYYVGSFDEKKFFRVIDSTGNYDNNGIKNSNNLNSNKLFFESYTEFEKFYKIGKPGGYKYLNEEENK
tara:strand:- start:4646 stop:4930 length:285 start_codon:yes stop_codon:yes gene_type:complete